VGLGRFFGGQIHANARDWNWISWPKILTPAISKLPPIAVKCGTIYQLGQMRIFQDLISLFNPKAVLPEPKVFKHLLSLASNHLSY